MTILFRYIFGKLFRILLAIMGMGLGIYLLTELVEKADIFIDYDSSISLIVHYFIARIPGIVAQILPAVFLLSTVITLCMMINSRELTALYAGGVSFTKILSVFLLCSVFWGCFQFVTSQFLAAEGNRIADELWQIQVRKRDVAAKFVNGVWFSENGWTISLEKLYHDGRGEFLDAFHVTENHDGIDTILHASSIQANENGWKAKNVIQTNTDTFVTEKYPELILPIHENHLVFFTASSGAISQLDIWQLSDIIDRLSSAGSNVEGMKTVWYGKIAYAFSLVVLALLGIVIVSWFPNIYLAVGSSMILTFVMYSFTMFAETLGTKGSFPPLVAAWGPNILLILIAALSLFKKKVSR